MKLIDLHTHSTASDGSLSPSELIDYAVQKRLAAVALTDHDTVSGLTEARDRALQRKIEFVPGLEISVKYDKGTMHILGYYIEWEMPFLDQALKELQEARKRRNPLMIKRLNELGVHITMDEVRDASGGGQIGRPHMAKVMVEKGYAKSIDDAFERYLKKNGPAYIEKSRLDMASAIDLIRKAGGVPVLAHPFTLNIDIESLEIFIRRLKKLGLVGIEAYYSEHTTSQIDDYLDLARRYDLIVTGGSDFHGHNKDEIDIGIGKGNLRISYELLEILKNTHKKMYTEFKKIHQVGSI